MNILGVGGTEIILIFVIMLIVAGPKRMIHWSYIAGKYLGQLRVMWSQMVDMVQKEFDEAGVDVKLPRQPPTRQELDRSIRQATRPLQEPLEKAMTEVKSEADQLRKETKEAKEATNTNEVKQDLNSKSSFGTWSGKG